MASWTYAELKSKVERDLDLIGEDFVTDEEMMAYCNDGIQEAHAEIVNLYEDYFLTKSTIALVVGQQEYDLPTNIFANKIRSVVYRDGSSFYIVKRLRDWKKFEQLSELSLSGNSAANFTYILRNDSVTDGYKMALYPIPQNTNNIDVWYIRDPAKVTLDADTVDIPEFASFVIQYIKVRCYEKEGNPNLPMALQMLEQQRALMQGTLTNMVPDSETEIERDCSFYDDFV